MKHTLPGLFALAFVVGPASAGTHTVKHVTITPDPNFPSARGNVGDVYNSVSTVEYVYCETRAYQDGWVDGFCYARTQTGETLQCHAMADGVIRQILGIHQDSTLAFTVDKYGRCSDVQVINGSLSAPKRVPAPDQDTSAIDLTDLGVKQ